MPRNTAHDRFNEAAADCRGKHRQECVAHCNAAASMRPRLIAAENARGQARYWSMQRCFNEAAADCRGKQAVEHHGIAQQLDASMRPRLIAAENEGRHAVPARDRRASMRPRLIAAENLRARRDTDGAILASMRPRLIAAENQPFRCFSCARVKLQ